jgi:hypothetical protein
VTERDSERRLDAIALIDHRGRMQLITLDDDDPQFVVHGNVCCGDRYEDDIAAKRFLSARNENAEVSIAIEAGALTGTIDFRRRDYEFSLPFSGEYNGPLTLEALAGVYTRTTTPLFGAPTTLTLAIDAAGRLTGSHSNGCMFDGSVSIPSAARSMVRIQMQMSGCGAEAGSSGGWNGSYEGLGILLRNAASPSNPALREDVFYHSTVGPTWLGPQPVGK